MRACCVVCCRFLFFLTRCEVEVIEFIMRPIAHGFQKRFHLTVSCDHPPCDKAQDCKDSLSVLSRFHSWMGEHFFNDGAEDEEEEDALGGASHIYLDGFALTVFRAAEETAKKFVAEGAYSTTARWLDVKLKYIASDVLKFANASMRMSQFLTSLSAAPEASTDHQRREINVYEIAHALWMWRRQMHIHWCYYRAMEEHAAGSDGSEKAFAKNLERGVACKVFTNKPGADVSGIDSDIAELANSAREGFYILPSIRSLHSRSSVAMTCSSTRS